MINVKQKKGSKSMKRITALIIVFMMLLSMSTAVLADGETAQTYVTVNVQPATYTVSVPQDVKFNIKDVLVPDNATSEDILRYYTNNNHIGSVFVSNAANCNYVVCSVQSWPLGHVIEEREDSSDIAYLDYYVKTVGFKALDVIRMGNMEDVWVDDVLPISPVGESSGKKATQVVYCEGRQYDNSEGALQDFAYTYPDLYMCVPESEVNDAVTGSYTCMLSFEFKSCNILPTD